MKPLVEPVKSSDKYSLIINHIKELKQNPAWLFIKSQLEIQLSQLHQKNITPLTMTEMLSITGTAAVARLAVENAEKIMENQIRGFIDIPDITIKELEKLINNEPPEEEPDHSQTDQWN